MSLVLVPEFEVALVGAARGTRPLLRPEITEWLHLTCPGSHQVVRVDPVLPVVLRSSPGIKPVFRLRWR